MSNLSTIIGQYGFPIVAAVGMGYFIYYVWTWVTTEIKPVIGQANGTLIALIDRIRMLDNDLIRLNQKVETVTREIPKIGRNEKCPCGSGLKYKKCHLKLLIHPILL